MEAYRDCEIREFFSGLVLLGGLQPILMRSSLPLFFFYRRSITTAGISPFIYSWHFSQQIPCQKEEYDKVTPFIDKHNHSWWLLFPKHCIYLIIKVYYCSLAMRKALFQFPHKIHVKKSNLCLMKYQIWWIVLRSTWEMHSVEPMVTSPETQTQCSICNCWSVFRCSFSSLLISTSWDIFVGAVHRSFNPGATGQLQLNCSPEFRPILHVLWPNFFYLGKQSPQLLLSKSRSRVKDTFHALCA